jgi:hypothetical protein
MSNATETREVRCQRPGCGRKLTSAKSRAAGYGPTCVRKMSAALDGLSDQQVDEAAEIAEAGGVRPTSREGVWGVASADWAAEYRTMADGHCNCRHGVGRLNATDNPCKHVGALRLTLITLHRAA